MVTAPKKGTDKSTPLPLSTKAKGANDRASKLSKRRSGELIIATVGAVGSGASKTAEALLQLLKDEYQYDGKIVKPSKIIDENGFRIVGDAKSIIPEDRVERLQFLGSELRKKYGNDYVVDKCITEINDSRADKNPTSDPRRWVTIIDSLKHPVEYARLKEVYGGAFWTVGVLAPQDVRTKRLRKLIDSNAKIAKIFEVDEEEGKPWGQRVRDTTVLSDYFIRNDSDKDDDLRRSVSRFLSLLFRNGVITPTNDETGMYAAMSAAMGSACLSRQVGAAIVDGQGNVIAKGRNDVPKFGGGLYGSEIGEPDSRCYKIKGGICHNDAHKSELIDEIMASIVAELGLSSNSVAPLRKVIENGRIKSLIEFSRSVHAEMDAILSVARAGSGKLAGSSMYSTTFPCHNCARHIIAAGIERVIYIEPYIKSLATTLHDDAISIHSKDSDKNVQFLQFEGVAPKNMLTLFSANGGRKEKGKLIQSKPSKDSPASMVLLDGFVVNETLVVHETGSKEQE